jgi:hypothetical protein
LIFISALWVWSYRNFLFIDRTVLLRDDGKFVADDSVQLDIPVIGRNSQEVSFYPGRIFFLREVERTGPTLLLGNDDPGYHRTLGCRWMEMVGTDSMRSLDDPAQQIGDNGGSVHFGFGFSRNRIQNISGAEIDGTNFRPWSDITTSMVMLPDWFVALLFAILPAICFFRWRRSRRRFAAHLCQTCGYDLRATPERCPECGGVPIAIPGKIA